MQGWKLKLLNQAGKEVMIKSVIQPIPSYAMSCFLLPKKLCGKLTFHVSNFWWKFDPESRGIHWNSWESMSLAKSEGGIGFRNFRAMNEALLARQGWRLLMTPQSFWARKWLYFSNSLFLNALRGHRASWAWMIITWERDSRERVEMACSRWKEY